MSPDDDVRALPTGAPSEKLSIIFAGVSIVTSIPKIVLELFGDRHGALRSFAIHPDQKPAVGPGRQFHRQQTQHRYGPHRRVHSG